PDPLDTMRRSQSTGSNACACRTVAFAGPTEIESGFIGEVPEGMRRYWGLAVSCQATKQRHGRFYFDSSAGNERFRQAEKEVAESMSRQTGESRRPREGQGEIHWAGGARKRRHRSVGRQTAHA